MKFGTIFIPVRLYAASENLHIGFHLVHKTDCGRVRYKKVCAKDGEELKPEDIVRAIDIAGECIQFTEEEIKNTDLLKCGQAFTQRKNKNYPEYYKRC